MTDQTSYEIPAWEYTVQVFRMGRGGASMGVEIPSAIVQKLGITDGSLLKARISKKGKLVYRVVMR
jgi:antitoxin component of MazEF toxin-antitoxin module